METITLACIDFSDLSPEFLIALNELSCCKGDAGFTFVVRLDYLEGWLRDIEYDFSKGHPYPAVYESLKQLITDLKTAGHNLLYVNGD